MVRRLPEDPTKRRREYFKRLYQHLDHWDALREDRGMDDVITTPEGEDIYKGDLMVGIDYLPERQRQAFELICLRGFTETAARDVLLPNSKSSTPVQQYSDSGLARMVRAYDLKQVGQWPPAEEPKPIKRKKKPTTRRKIMATPLHPLIRKHLDDAERDILAQMEALKVALVQVRVMRGDNAESPPPVTLVPTAKPEGKPSLEEAAKDLAAEG